MKLPRNNVGFSISLGVALVLTMVDMPHFAPDVLTYFTPNFALLVCYFWATNLPTNFSVWVVWLFGFLFDALHAEPFGLNGLILCIVVLVGLNLPRRSNRPIVGYQLLGLLCLVIFSEIVRLIVMQFVEYPVRGSILVMPWSIVASLAFWFVVVVVLDRWIFVEESNVSFQ